MQAKWDQDGRCKFLSRSHLVKCCTLDLHRRNTADSSRGLPMCIWKRATTRAGYFANGPAAHYCRIAVLRVLKSCGPKVPAFPFLGFAYACSAVARVKNWGGTGPPGPSPLYGIMLVFMTAQVIFKSWGTKRNYQILKCLKCCFWCLEKFLKCLNKNAYIMVAIHGKNFCKSAKDAFFLLMRNIVRVVVLDKVTDFILFLGQLTITAGIAVGSFYWFERQENLNYYLAPVIIITVGSYVVAHAFFSVYNMAIDTIFLCFLEDSERNDGSPEKPFYMSKPLRKLLGKKNKKRESDSD